MKSSSILALASSVALASAQFKYHASTDSFTCATRQLAAYCAGGSIIIRCSDGVGIAGNCNDNLAGEPPIGVGVDAGCYQSTPSSGDAACTKNGIVYPASGAGDDTSAPYPVPGSIVPGAVSNTNKTTHTYKIGTFGTGTGIGYPGANSTMATTYKWSNATASPDTTVTVQPIITVTVPCSTSTSTTATAAPVHTTTTSHTTTSTTQTSTSSSSSTSSSASATVVVSTGGATALGVSSLALLGALALGLTF